jgi:hypothetical protein
VVLTLSLENKDGESCAGNKNLQVTTSTSISEDSALLEIKREQAKDFSERLNRALTNRHKLYEIINQEKERVESSDKWINKAKKKNDRHSEKDFSPKQ